jgi:hypothetical protein
VSSSLVAISLISIYLGSILTTRLDDSNSVTGTRLAIFSSEHTGLTSAGFSSTSSARSELGLLPEWF